MRGYDDDPQNDLYELMDRAGLVPSHIKTALQSTEKTVNQIRGKLMISLKQYIQEREMRHASKAITIKKFIEVQDGEPTDRAD